MFPETVAPRASAVSAVSAGTGHTTEDALWRRMREPAVLGTVCGVLLLGVVPLESSDLVLAFLGAMSYTMLYSLKRKGIMTAA
eukprot:CAMPEP_0170634708 /NCGR_PEP_ID=MMETSP0224-20130122/36771_1 /TAXON_ID=285029 /ORGANISM="Togula jolla, Strain CCCM 725" /LENGTH=82 /DNA_ID=CAMNT_0010964037 /DNA_START=98 /DNA_END=346 /DNA_ORIENTATION=+